MSDRRGWSTCRCGPGRPIAGWGLELGEPLREALGVGRVVVVGRAPNRTGPEDLPITGACGRSLARLVGLELGLRWLLEVDRVNLLQHWPGRRGRGDGWDGPEARRRALEIAPLIAPRRAVLLGREVCCAFGARDLEPLAERWVELDGARLLVGHLPHPSGLCRWWNQAANMGRARAWLADFLWGDGLKLEARAAR